ncbi:hypothetical protein D9611_002815 [Ephemerocybe angulata]|uniref:DUF4470 domain-containing protein n=1 Tax=Ephemerocybe angulata TaxID=980116 RepID=A0A8H5FDV2_9AGAR|nr:hypothetical protein D9611_002815 [Tulosesus angulatus]
MRVIRSPNSLGKDSFFSPTMAHPTLWLPKSFFYPIGNTPATSLTEYIPPDVDAKVLVLGCGDFRNTLYTIFSDSKLPFERALDFTFCDVEPAVLARNILIYTLLYDRADEETIRKVWKIYVDVFIDKESFDLIVAQCTKLVDLSSSVERWGSHPYGTFIKFCTEDTMVTLRQYWGRYLFKDRDAAAAKPAVLKESESGRASGIMILEYGLLGAEHFKHYWKHGVTDVDHSEMNRATHVNTTLLYSSSGDALNIHYGTHPISCFHLAPALAPTQEHPSTPAKSMPGIIAIIKSQFAGWCSAFHHRMTDPHLKANVKLRFFAGNAITFCKALRAVLRGGPLRTTEYTNSWGCSTIFFAEDYLHNSAQPAPLSFNVIETSNLADHIGFLNILLITSPLLEQTPTSVLFTHCLVGSKDASRQHLSALEQIGVDLPLISLVFGLSPERATSMFTSQSMAQEAMASGLNQSLQLFEFNLWRTSAPAAAGLAQTFTCQPADLARTLFKTYLSLFPDEGFAGYKDVGKPGYGLRHHTRDSFIYLLSLVKDSFSGDWNVVMDCIMLLVESDRTLLVGLQNYQDLCRGLHLADLRKVMPDPNEFAVHTPNKHFENWAEPIPSSVHVGLVVPRVKIQKLLDEFKEIVTPCLQCSLMCPGGQSFFTSIQPTFGRVEISGTGAGKTVIIHEDQAGWWGRSDLVVYFPAPAWMFVKWAFKELEVGLSMFGVSAMNHFIKTLGLQLCIFSTVLTDQSRTFVLRDRPRLASQTALQNEASAGPPLLPSPSPAEHIPQQVTLKFGESRPSSLTIQCLVEDPTAKANLADKSTKVEAKSITVTSVEVSFKAFKSTLHFPYPIDHTTLVTRIARKSSYVEIEGRILSQRAVDIPVELKPFPVALLDGGGIHALGMHYLALDALPSFRSPLPPKYEHKWMQPHFSFSLMEEKEKAKAKMSLKPQPPSLELKDSLFNIFSRFLGTNKGNPTMFHLSQPADGVGTYAILFVSRVKIDLTAHTVVADACVLPFSYDTCSLAAMHVAIRKMESDIRAGRLRSISVQTPEEERAWWMAYLPTAVERCRTWKHKVDCKYLTEGAPRGLGAG